MNVHPIHTIAMLKQTAKTRQIHSFALAMKVTKETEKAVKV